MAFMMPVVKNDYDIYKSNRARKTSECNTSSTPPGRARKISEGSFISSGSPKKETPVLLKHYSVPDRMSSRGFSRPRTSSEHIPNRAKTSSVQLEKSASSSTSNLQKQSSVSAGTSWLDKLKKFVKNSKSEEERTKS